MTTRYLVIKLFLVINVILWKSKKRRDCFCGVLPMAMIFFVKCEKEQKRKTSCILMMKEKDTIHLAVEKNLHQLVFLSHSCKKRSATSRREKGLRSEIYCRIGAMLHSFHHPNNRKRGKGKSRTWIVCRLKNR